MSDTSPVGKIEKDVEEIEKIVQELRIHNAVLDEKIQTLKDDVKNIPSMYVLIADFAPVKRYLNLILIALLGLVFTAIGAVVFNDGSSGLP